ncbi:MAG: YybH family protein [Calditrichia bacterium]
MIKGKSIGLLILLVLYSSSIFAQTEADVEEINLQIWKPFMEAYNQFDADGFNALHSDDILRANAWGIRIGQEYKDSNSMRYDEAKTRGDQRSIELRFEQRLVRENIAYEVGYYKILRIRNGKEEEFYGRFHVVLKKFEDEWKIVQDWDADQINGQPVTEKDFLKMDALTFETEQE